jgi:hypothetical protein
MTPGIVLAPTAGDGNKGWKCARRGSVGADDDDALGGSDGACVCWLKMYANCWSLACWLSETGQMGDVGDGWHNTLVRSSAAEMVVSA